MRILLWNIGYLIGDRQAWGGYLPSIRSGILGDGRVEERTTSRLLELVAERAPEVICLVEVDRGSIRTTTDGQLREVMTRLRAAGLEYTGGVFNKYGEENVFGRLPFFRHLGNAIVMESASPTTSRYLSTGMKRLVIEAELPHQITLLLAHLSVRAGSRHRQLRELANLVNDHRVHGPVIVAGDLNTYRGLDELDRFRERTGLELHAPGPTVPERVLDKLLVSSRALDMFLCSPELTIANAEVLTSEISDHRPVMLDVAL